MGFQPRWSSILSLLLSIIGHSFSLKWSLLKAISTGRVHSIEGWVSDVQLQKLRALCFQIQKEGYFESSGLSYAETLSPQNATSERLVCDEIPSHYLKNKSFNQLIDQIDQLRMEISNTLSRPSMKRNDLPHESYISLSYPGTYLKRHMDEKHQELRPSNGWTLSTRRSISWLLYLNDQSWDPSINGGQLRSFPQKARQHPFFYGNCGCHQGNLQIGWLECKGSVKPVYMESWSPINSNLKSSSEDSHLVSQSSRSISKSRRINIASTGDISSNTIEYQEILPMPKITSALYVLSVFKRKVFITSKFIAHDDVANLHDEPLNKNAAKSMKNRKNEKPSLNFLNKCLVNMKTNYLDISTNSNNKRKYQFSLIENYASWIEDERGQENGGKSLPPINTVSEELLPKGGTLCLFDSVSLPHEVLRTLQGERLAIAGWFHEIVKPPKNLPSLKKIPSDEIDYINKNYCEKDNLEPSARPSDIYEIVQSGNVMVAAYKAMSYKSKK